jgi:hypothetical protein
MANYYASARSNYFRVRDLASFTRTISEFPDLSIVEDAKGRVGLLCDSEDGWPSGRFDPNDEYVEVDVPELVAVHLADDQVAVFMETGAEKLCYIAGFAVAINHAGERRKISLSDIYDLASELGPEVSEAVY